MLMNNYMNSLHLAPMIQLLAILYLTYLVVFKKYKGLGVFFIIFGISALVARDSYNMNEKKRLKSYQMMWYNFGVITIILCAIGLIFSWM